MSSFLVTVLLWTAALGSGIVAGIYFAFSVFIMKAFDEIGAEKAIIAMNSINKVILHSLFIPLFFGSSIVSVLLMIVAVARWGDVGSGLILVAGMSYFLGMFVCTVLFNVPLNNELATLDSNSTNVREGWSHYLKTWTNWNHVRTISSLATCIVCILILVD